MSFLNLELALVNVMARLALLLTGQKIGQTEGSTNGCLLVSDMKLQLKSGNGKN